MDKRKLKKNGKIGKKTPKNNLFNGIRFKKSRQILFKKYANNIFEWKQRKK